MFSSSPNYTKLKTNLRLAISRLKLLQKKKTELTEKSRREIADYISGGKYERAKVRVEYIIREDYLVEALEIVEMYCDLLLARFGLISNMKELDEGISEAVSSLIWVAPRLQSDIQELKVISDLLSAKYGPSFAEACRVESIEAISPKLKHKMSIQSPPKLLVEKYVIEIAKSYNIPYEPDPQVMEMDKGKDALLIDLSNSNDLGGGGGMPQPPGFLGYPQPPPLPHLMDPDVPGPFGYTPPNKDFGGPSAPPPSFSYNIPPGLGDEKKESNTDYSDHNLPTYHNLYPDANFQGDKKGNNFGVNVENSDDKPKPAPRLKMNDKTYDLPELPSVPSSIPDDDKQDDIDFDDLTRRFNELKKKY
ncbi:IST1 homolog isoform X3 [Anoplophora glabripennis]|uniref:IST1 homolog isoform X3 n=1 Tax=Anoplophora glabripennis TaxID=217634 RepID=UPI000873BC41|nr:IST1 homolog isoform X3 [Anoplophora glabripennis]